MKKKILQLSALALSLTACFNAHADQVFNDDVIITFSACIGNDCANGESFGFDTMRVKENNLRIHFDDTSTSASFPKNDWRIVANDSANGGDNYLAFEDSTAGRQVFRVDAGAPANALRVDSAGDVGIGVSNPVVDLHVKSGNSPTLRLEQDGSSGFTAQTWDLAGNEANFFVRDVTNGSQLPFKIKPGADTGSLFIAADGDVGMGTENPDAHLHVRDTTASGYPYSLVLETESSDEFASLALRTKTNSIDLNNSSNTFRINIIDSTTANWDLQLDANSDLTIKGDLIYNENVSLETVIADILSRLNTLENP